MTHSTLPDSRLPADAGSITRSEIASQPQLWRRAFESMHDALPGLPEPGERVLVLGCGTSYYVAAAYAWLREQNGSGVTDALIASELPPITRQYDRVIAISRSGTTTEVVHALETLAGRFPVTAVLGERGTPVESLAEDVIDLGYADERSVVQTRFPTTLLTLLRVHLGADEGTISSLIDQAEKTLAHEPTTQVPRQLVVLGTGWAEPLTQEAALKCREAAGIWAEAYATGEYRHGPIGVAGPGTLVWAMSPLTELENRVIEDTGAVVHQGANDPQVELVALQQHAVAWAAANDRNPDSPTHLSRSVVAV